MTRPRLAAAALAALALSACTAPEARLPQGAGQGATQPAGGRYASLDALALGTGAAAPVRAATALVALPEWIGRPTRLQEREDADGLEQAIGFGPGGAARENLVLIAVPRSEAGLGRLAAGGTAMGRPTEAAIRAEIAAAFPGTAMQVVTRPAANAYGPYGLAVGQKAGGTRCLYAWQWIAEAPALDGGRAGPASLRVRLCRGDMTLEAMAAAVNQLTLVPRWQGEAVAPAPSPRRHDAAPVRRARVAAVSRHRDEAPRRETTARTEPDYPRATAYGTAPAYAPAYQAAPALPAAERGGRRYLGEDSGPARAAPAESASLRALRPDGGSSAPQAGIAADLPPEAYRGPSRP